MAFPTVPDSRCEGALEIPSSPPDDAGFIVSGLAFQCFFLLLSMRKAWN